MLAEIKHNGRTTKINQSKRAAPITLTSISVSKSLSDPNNIPHPPNPPSQRTPTKTLATKSHITISTITKPKKKKLHPEKNHNPNPDLFQNAYQCAQKATLPSP
jgi:hypothetical protein